MACIRFLQAIDTNRDLARLPDLSNYFICAVESGVVAAVEAVVQHSDTEHLQQEVRSAVLRAAALGHLDCLKYLIERGFLSDIYSAGERAVCGGQTACVQYLHEHGYMLQSRWADCAAAYGHADCLRYLLQHTNRHPHAACVTAARRGHHKCMRVAHKMGCEGSAELCTTAAAAGSLPSLRVAHEEMHGELKEDVLIAAARCGDTKIIDYALARGVAPSARAILAAVESCKYDCMVHMHQRGFPLPPQMQQLTLDRQLEFQYFLYAFTHQQPQEVSGHALQRYKMHALAAYLRWVENTHVQWRMIKKRGKLWRKQHSWHWHCRQVLLALFYVLIQHCF